MSSDFSLLNTALIWAYTVLLWCIPLFAILGVAQVAVAIGYWRSEKRTRRLKRGGIFLLIAALIPLAQLGLWRGVIRPSLGRELMAKSGLAQEEQFSKTSNRRAGDKSEDFEKLFGETESPHGPIKIVVVNFFATWCGPCLAELPHLQRLADKYADRNDVLFVVVGRDETRETLDAFVADNGFQMLFVPDPDRTIYSEFANEIIPRTYLIDRDRTIRFEIIGFDEEMLKELDARLQSLTSM
ncbi:MAG: TlpA family protein disulfide reductase [Planctomycetota bacterium]|nr:MAG: TlpA family protein disulfide reductase [Planctomycetota bacterium]